MNIPKIDRNRKDLLTTSIMQFSVEKKCFRIHIYQNAQSMTLVKRCVNNIFKPEKSISLKNLGHLGCTFHFKTSKRGPITYCSLESKVVWLLFIIIIHSFILEKERLTVMYEWQAMEI